MPTPVSVVKLKIFPGVALSSYATAILRAALLVSLVACWPVRAGQPAPDVASLTLAQSRLPQGLDVPLELQGLLVAGRDAVLSRRYEEADRIFELAEQRHPDSPVGPLGRMLVYQSRMLENYDLAWAESYEQVSEIARGRIATTLTSSDNDAWDHLLGGAFHGMDGLHAMRTRSYLRSIGAGLDAVRHLEASQRQAPQVKLHDLDLGLGAYDYFRSVVKRQAPWLPFFPDRRDEGLRQMKAAYLEGEFMQPLAQLALVFVMIDEGRIDDSIEMAQGFLERYPDNVVARIQLARGLARKARYPEAIAQLEAVADLHPDNRIVGYYLGNTLVRQGSDYERAEKVLFDFVYRAPDDEWRGWGLELLGDIYARRGNLEHATSFWRQAKRNNPSDKSVKRKLGWARKQAKAARRG